MTATDVQPIAERLNATYGNGPSTDITQALIAMSLAVGSEPTTRHGQTTPTTADALDALRLVQYAQYSQIGIDHCKLEIFGFLRVNGVSWAEIGAAYGRRAEAVYDMYNRLRGQFPGWNAPAGLDTVELRTAERGK